MKKYSFGKSAITLIALLPLIASAHTGHDGGTHHIAGFVEGLSHPFTGVDHLAAMIAVGIWSAMTARRIWIVPAAFMSAMLVGATMSIAAVSVPAVEPLIAASLFVLGLLVSTQVKMPAVAASLIIGVFALFHGAAHGTELANADSAFGALTGMLLGTLLLHLFGLAIGRRLQTRSAWLPRVTGGAVALLGLGLLAGVV